MRHKLHSFKVSFIIDTMIKQYSLNVLFFILHNKLIHQNWRYLEWSFIRSTRSFIYQKCHFIKITTDQRCHRLEVSFLKTSITSVIHHKWHTSVVSIIRHVIHHKCPDRWHFWRIPFLMYKACDGCYHWWLKFLMN
jgi:hypothetical protein